MQSIQQKSHELLSVLLLVVVELAIHPPDACFELSGRQLTSNANVIQLDQQ